MKRRTHREIELAEVLLAIWECAQGATADVERGHASFTALAESLSAIAEDAAEALADLPIACTVADEA
jgi:hypothetical protein